MRAWSLRTHIPYMKSGGDERCARLSARGAPGERVAVSFDIAADATPVPVTVAAAPLAGRADASAVLAIDSTDIDVHVVAVRDQAGIGVHRAARTAVSELLLKDDGVELRGTYSRLCGHWRHLHRARHGARYYRAPEVRLSGAVSTVVRAFERKQIWVTVRLRPDLAPGRYGAAIDITDASGGESLPLSIDVLPIELREPPQRRMVWFRGALDCRSAQFYLRPRHFLAQLRDIRTHGFDTVSISERSPALFKEALALARAAGFTDLVLQPPLPDGLQRADLEGFNAVCYVSDEIDWRGQPFHASHRENARLAERLGIPTMASFLDARFIASMPALGLGGRPDLASLYLPTNVDVVTASAGAAGASGSDTLYYWMASMEKPNVHRVLAGLYLWRSGAAGIAPYCYQHLPRAPFDPYDDFDEWEPVSNASADAAPLKDQLATYPSRHGPVPTLQWEGLGEGLTDLRYIATVEHWLREARRRGDAAMNRLCDGVDARLRAIASAIPLAPIQIADDRDAEPYAGLDARDYARFREMLADDAVALSRHVASGSATHELVGQGR